MDRRLLIIILILVVVALSVFFAGQFFSSEEVVVPVGSPVSEGNDRPSESIVESTDAYDVTARYPTLKTEEAQFVATFIQSETQEFIARAEEDIPQLREIGFSGGYVLDIDYTLYEVAGVTSYVVSEYQYTGGANGNATLRTFVFDEDGELLELADVVPEGLRENLLAEVQAKLVSSGGFLDAVENLTFEDFENFYITETELVIGFSEYEVAPGAAGIVEVRLPIEAYVKL